MRYFASIRFWALILFGPLALTWLMMAIVYGTTPVYIDHGESAMVVTTLQWLHGRPLYHAADSAYLYSVFQGPFGYLWLGLALKVCPDPILASKLAGGFWSLAALSLALLVFWRSTGIVVAISGVGVVAGTLLIDMLAPFWDRPDPILFFAVALGLGALTLRRREVAAAILVLTFAVATDCKIHGVLYLIPVLVVWLRRHGLRSSLFIVCLGVLLASVPFLLPGISLTNYLYWLQLGSHQERTFHLFLENIETLIQMILPLVLFMGHPLLRWTWRDATEETVIFYSMILAGLLVAIPASKVGAGWHHMLPLAMYVGYLFSGLLASSPDQLKLRWTLAVVALWAFLSYQKTINNVSYVIWYMQTMPYQAFQDDLRQILTVYPADKTQMGVGYGGGYIATFYSPWLYREGTPSVAVIVTCMDLKELGIYPQAFKKSLETEQYGYWLIPRDGPPFSMNSWYDSQPLFDDSIRQAFAQHYARVNSSQFFDIYQAKTAPH